MGCNCSGGGAARAQRTTTTSTPRTTSTAAQWPAVAAGAKTWYEVWRNGVYVGRRSDSLITAQTIANRMGGEVRVAS